MAIKSVTVQKSAVRNKAHAVGMVRRAVGANLEAIEVKDTDTTWEIVFFSDGIVAKGSEKVVDVSPGITMVTATKIDIPAGDQQDMQEKARNLAWAVDDDRYLDEQGDF